jgi:hypothetical protein
MNVGRLVKKICVSSARARVANWPMLDAIHSW